MTDPAFTRVTLYGDERDDPQVPCDICNNRLGQHAHVVEGNVQYACCRCWIWVLDKAPVEWHIECPRYHVEKRGKPGDDPGTLLIVPGRGRPKKRRRG
jgi:hypothetical protein